MLGTKYMGPQGTAYNNLILLRGIDPNGNVTPLEVAYTYPDILPTKLLYTPNGEYIVVGYHLEPISVGGTTYGKQPFAAKFNAAGVFQWMQVYQVNGIAHSRNGVERVNIVYCPNANPAIESYIITYTADQNFYTPLLGPGMLNEDATIGALRLDGTNGNPIWAAKYYLPFAARSTESIHGDYPHALAYGKGKYFISGITDISPVTPPYYNNFMMTININGGIVDDYRRYVVGNRTLTHDAIYDAGTNEFVMSMALEGANTPIALTAFDVMKVDQTTLNVNDNDFYYDQSSMENYAVSIKETPDQQNYIIGGTISGDPFNNWALGTSTGLLKINKAGAVQFLRRYNPLRDQDPSAVTVYADPVTGLENYRIGITPYGAVTPGGIDMRVLTTDDIGDIPCWSMERSYGTTHTVPLVAVPETLTVAVAYAPNPVTPLMLDLNTSMTICTGPASKSLSVYNTVPGKTFKVYPTLLAAGDDKLNFEISSTGGTTLTITAVAMDGRTIGKYETAIKEGDNKLSWQLPTNVPGNYILNISSADNSIRKAERISKL